MEASGLTEQEETLPEKWKYPSIQIVCVQTRPWAHGGGGALSRVRGYTSYRGLRLLAWYCVWCQEKKVHVETTIRLRKCTARLSSSNNGGRAFSRLTVGAVWMLGLC